MPIQYTEHQYPCIDKYPPGKQFLTNEQLYHEAQDQVAREGLQGKLQATQAFQVLKAVFKVDTIWNPQQYPVINIYFMDGTAHERDWVYTIVDTHISPHVSRLQFNWESTQPESHIRITFAQKGQAWSMVGTDALQLPPHEPTMNLGWLDDDQSYGAPALQNSGQVVIHEFGHALGMIHEHQSPRENPIVWNKDVIYNELQQTNGWTPEQVDHNMFKKYGDAELCEDAQMNPDPVERALQTQNYCSGELVNGSEYDMHSVMHYFFPPHWILEGPTEIPVNKTLSILDQTWLRHYYGEPFDEDEDTDSEDEDTDRRIQKYVYDRTCLSQYLRKCLREAKSNCVLNKKKDSLYQRLVGHPYLVNTLVLVSLAVIIWWVVQSIRRRDRRRTPRRRTPRR